MRARDYVHSEFGGATGWSLFIFAAIAVVAGLAIDGSNGMRAQEHLKSTADIAAHTGVVELAGGASDLEIQRAAETMAQVNMPVAIYGDVVGDTETNVLVGHYDGVSFSEGDTPRNAVRVDLSMSEASGNPVRTFLLGFIGQDSWDVNVSSLITYDDTGLCDGNDGIYAHGEVKITSSADIGANFCIFSKVAVELSNHNVFTTGAHVAMPDLAKCKHCTDDHNPGVEDAKSESNLQLANVSAHVSSTMASMLGTSSDRDPVIDFMASTSLDSDLSPLSDLNYQTSKMKEGDVVSISASNFESLPSVPSGLIYAVYCGSPLAGVGAHTPKAGGNSGSTTTTTSKTKGNSKKTTTTTTSGGGNPKSLSFESSSGSSIRGVAVMTDCQLDFGNNAYIQKSVIATSSTSNQSVSAGSNAVIGSTALSCPHTEKVVIMSQGNMRIPAALETNNVDFIIAGDVNLASGTSKKATKRGTSFYIGGEAQIAAQGTWLACGDTEDSFNPDVKVIRHVVETLAMLASTN